MSSGNGIPKASDTKRMNEFMAPIALFLFRDLKRIRLEDLLQGPKNGLQNITKKDRGRARQNS